MGPRSGEKGENDIGAGSAATGNGDTSASLLKPAPPSILSPSAEESPSSSSSMPKKVPQGVNGVHHKKPPQLSTSNLFLQAEQKQPQHPRPPSPVPRSRNNVVAMNRNETILVTPSGDVLVCRSEEALQLIDSRSTSKSKKTTESIQPKRTSSVFGSATQLCDPTDLNPGDDEGELGTTELGLAEVASGGYCNPCNPNQAPPSPVVGYSTDNGIRPLQTFSADPQYDELSLTSATRRALDSSNKENAAVSAVDGPLAIVPSFDYSHFMNSEDDGGADDQSRIQSPPRRARLNQSRQSLSFTNLFMSSAHLDGDEHPTSANGGVVPSVSTSSSQITAPPEIDVSLPGIPTFLKSLSQIRISQISAHPMGYHTLLISEEGLLFSYGTQNDYGQCGHGGTQVVLKPTVVTPLLEHGGKAVTCAAGPDYSLVVVQTENRRRRRTGKGSGLPSSAASSTSGWGTDKEDSPKDGGSSNNVVGYNHQVYAFGRNQHGKLGLVSPNSGGKSNNKSTRGDCVLRPKRVALGCKVKKSDDVGTPSSSVGCGIVQLAASTHHSAAVVVQEKQPCLASHVYVWGTVAHRVMIPQPRLVESLLATSAVSWLRTGEAVSSLALGPKSITFGMTTADRAFCIGGNDGDLLMTIGRPPVPRSPSRGPSCATLLEPRELTVPNVQSISVGAQHAVATTRDGQVYEWGRIPGSGLETSPAPKKLRPAARQKEQRTRPRSSSSRNKHNHNGENQYEDESMALAAAGYDLTVLVSKEGRVSSVGVSSGRLGQGAWLDPMTPITAAPKPMFGGLRLWR